MTLWPTGRLTGSVIADALSYDPSVGPQIEPDSIEVNLVSGGDPREPAFSVSFKPLGGNWVSKMKFVRTLREGGIQS